ncbi:MAG: hypothetical protein WC697_01020 [Patescibacteria group bacterium]|jgi:hypothetical protein
MQKQEWSIEKPWCVCLGPSCPIFIGKVQEDDIGGVYVKRSEKPGYYKELWNPPYVLRFGTIVEAIIKFANLSHKHLKQVKDSALFCFPSEEERIREIKS